MELDFSKLNNIEKTFTESPINDFKDEGHIKPLAENKTAPESNIKPVSGIDILDNIKTQKEPPKKYLTIEKEKRERDNARQVYADHQENILKSSSLRSEINKDIYEAADPYIILLKAIKCIGLMTGDALFYTSNKDKLKDIYGTTGNSKAIEQELQEVKIRLERLKEAQEREPNENIKRAIQKHQQKQEELKKKLLVA